MRSMCARRSNCIGSAAPLGRMPWVSSFASTKWSIGLRGHLVSFTSGTTGFLNCWNAQWSSGRAAMISSSGYFAPAAIHALSSVIWLSVKGAPSRGMRSSSSLTVTRAMSSPISTPEAWINLPASNRSLAFCFRLPWQVEHLFLRSGLMSFK